ncbi:MCE family protein [Mycobacterium sp.]|uniref:MCE family protein n=1 Tax=Mycobacterium sp. TaxID=1785 RepID=UPI002D93B18A|nr:MCE family protein [Mycobacterium sp.]
MRSIWCGALPRFGIFAVVMAVLSGFLFFVFGEYRTGSENTYSAVFADASSLKSGDSVRVAGVRVGTVASVSLREDNSVLVTFDADRDIVFTAGTKAAVRYLNLVGDRYLELVDGPGSTSTLAAGSQISIDRTSPALDLDLLLSGLKPVTQGLNPQDVNALTQSLLQVLQGQGEPLQSLLAQTSSFTNDLADNDQVVQQLIDNLNIAAGTLAADGDKFSGTVDRLQQFISGLAADRDAIGEAIESLDNGTASLADLLTNARAPLAGTVNELNRLAPNLDLHKEHIDAGLQKAPNNYRKLARLGAYGSFFNYYLCGVTLRVTDLQGRTAVFPWLRQETGRCSDN